MPGTKFYLLFCVKKGGMKKDKKISKKEKELKNLFPKEIHSKIDFFINEKNWADLYFCEPHRKYFIFKNIERYLEESL